jgi:hypothetical protein
MNLKCEEVVLKPSPCSLQHFALAAWINGRKDWDPELGLHLCKVSKTINDIVFDCNTKLKYGSILYTYNNLREIIEWEKKRHGQIQSICSYSRRWLSKSAVPRAWITVKLQDEIEMEEYPYKKRRRRFILD